LLKKTDIRVFELDLFEDIEKINKMHYDLCAYEMAQTHKNWFSDYRNLYRPKTIELIEKGLQISEDEIIKIKENREDLFEKVGSIQEHHKIQLWISPATLTTPPKGLESTGSPLMNLPWSFIGFPTLTHYVDKSLDNLPIGIQYTAELGKDEYLFEHVGEIAEEILLTSSFDDLILRSRKNIKK